jgi:hypothetical protein
MAGGGQIARCSSCSDQEAQASCFKASRGSREFHQRLAGLFNQRPAVAAFRGGPERTHRIRFYFLLIFFLLSTTFLLTTFLLPLFTPFFKFNLRSLFCWETGLQTQQIQEK